jgi:hypothetical protein
MDKTLVFIINFNRLTLPKNICEYLSDNDTQCEPIILDNNSDYPPLLEWYEGCPFKVERMHLNYGNCVLYTSGILEKYNIHGGYIYTDPDLDLSGIPKDFLHVLQTGLDRYSWADKCGFSLDINNLPDNELTQDVLKWETGYWSNKLDEMYFKAPIDTTFALFRTRMHSFECLRTDKPYCARHVPWHWTKTNIPDDERYYINSISSDFNHYSNQLKKLI